MSNLPSSSSRRILLERAPFVDLPRGEKWDGLPGWPARWIACPDIGSVPWVAAFRLVFVFDEAQARTLRFHVSADERYELFLDGARLGRGPERCDNENWFFETWETELAPGRHVFVARVWALGKKAPLAQHSVQPGFLFCPDKMDDSTSFSTGHAPWEALPLPGYEFIHPRDAFGVGHRIQLSGYQVPWGWERGEGDGWKTAIPLEQAFDGLRRNGVVLGQHRLFPARLPAMLDQPVSGLSVRHVSSPTPGPLNVQPYREVDNDKEGVKAWQQLVDASVPVIIPPHSRRRILIDFNNYVCVYPEVVVSGGAGAKLQVHFQESLLVDPPTKRPRRREHRAKIEGNYFGYRGNFEYEGLGDTFLPDGGFHRPFSCLWWLAGRYVQVVVETADKPLVIESLSFRETRYPLELESQFSSSDPRLEALTPIAHRTLQMCAHETYMDCPFYEQLMYIGDTRLQCLLTYATSTDDRLPRKALKLLGGARLDSGLLPSRNPSRNRQNIPPFSLWWINMLQDYALWRRDSLLVRSLLPVARGILDSFLLERDGATGLIRSPQGWNFVDWVEEWDRGEPAGGSPGKFSPALNAQFILACAAARDLEIWHGDPELVARWDRLGGEILAAMEKPFWCAERGLYADDPEKKNFSEHVQCLMLLSGFLPPERQQRVATALFGGDLIRTTVYFTYYLFEACVAQGRMDVMQKRLEPWFDMIALDFKTTYEMADPTLNRSDCHAWSAYPLFHYYTAFAGIRPTAPGFTRVCITPQPGNLSRFHASMVHPDGRIDVNLSKGKVDRWTGSIALPPGLKGDVVLNGKTLPLLDGATTELS